MAKSKPTAKKVARKAAAKKPAAKAVALKAVKSKRVPADAGNATDFVSHSGIRHAHGPSVDKGVEVATAFNEGVREAVQAGEGEGVAAAPVTWPTEYGNRTMVIPPATPVNIVDGEAVPATPADAVGVALADDSEPAP